MSGWKLHKHQKGFRGYGVGVILGPPESGSYIWIGFGRNVLTYNWGRSSDYDR